MRSALITFFASLLGVIVALGAWRTWERLETERARDDAARIQQETVHHGQQLDEAVIAEERAIEAIRSDVVATASARTAVTEFYLSNARMPRTNAEVGLPDSAKYRGRSLRSLSIGDGGRLVLTFDALSGRDGGVLEIVPDLSGTEAMGVQWHCTTRDFPQIMRALPSCAYEPSIAPANSAPQAAPTQPQ